MLAILLIVAAISGFCLLPQPYTEKIGLKIPRRGRTKRLYQGVFFGSLILLTLYLKLVPFSLILGVIAVALMVMDRVKERMLDNDDLREDHKPAGGGAGEQSQWRPASSAMEVSEAYSVLGLKEDASVEDVDAAYKRLIGQLHPDRGGTDYLAAKLNEARSTLKARLKSD